MSFTSKEYELSKQPIRINKVKVLLLDKNLQEIGELTGDTVEFPSFNINADSDIRRTCTVTINPKDSSFDVTPDGKIWLDKYIKIFIGQKDVNTQQYTYTNMGIYLVENPQKVYSVTENKLTIQGVDMMARLTGLRNGNLEGLEYVIPQDSNVRNTIISTLELAQVTRYQVSDCLDELGNIVNVPNEIRINVGGTVHNILVSLRDIMPNYQMYFDVDGVFHYDKIPSGDDEEIVVTDDIWDINLLDYKRNTDFDYMKNSIEIIGKTHEVQYYFDKVETSKNSFLVDLTEDDEFIPLIGTKIALNIKERVIYSNLKLRVTKTMKDGTIKTYSYNILNEYDESPIMDRKDGYYVFKIAGEEANYWTMIGSQAEAENVKTAVIKDKHFVITDENLNLTDLFLGTFDYTFKTPKTNSTSIEPIVELSNGSTNNVLSFTKGKIENIYRLNNNSVYTIRFNFDVKDMYAKYLGGATPYAKVQDHKAKSPFSVKSSIGVINQVFAGGEYDNISSDILAEQRANWELYTHCRLNDNVTINCIPIYWLDVNCLISITLPDASKKEEELITDLYMVKSISIGGGNGSTQSINLVKYYPYNIEDERITYGIRIYHDEPDPSKRVEYTYDAVGKKPCHMNYETGEFDYGDWEDAFFLPKPCMVRTDGGVDYYLNPNNYAEKIDGTPSDINNVNYDGNAMMEWGSKGKKIYVQELYNYSAGYTEFIITNVPYLDSEYYASNFLDVHGHPIKHFYTSIYNGVEINDKYRSISNQEVVEKNLNITKLKNNGDDYEVETSEDRSLINMLLVLMGKSTDTQDVFGNGFCVENSTALKTGTMDDKGLFWGSNEYDKGVKVFGIENYWGNVTRSLVGYMDSLNKVYYNTRYWDYGYYSPRRSNTDMYYYDLDSSEELGYKFDFNLGKGKFDKAEDDFKSSRNKGDTIKSVWGILKHTTPYETVNTETRSYYTDGFRGTSSFAGVLAMGGDRNFDKEKVGAFCTTYTEKIRTGGGMVFKPSYVPTYLITYVMYGFTRKVELEELEDCLDVKFTIPHQENYHFVGWSLSEGGAILESYIALSDSVLYAVYEEDSREEKELEDFDLRSGFQIPDEESVHVLDLEQGFRYLTFTCIGDGIQWMMHPNIGGWGSIWAGFRYDFTPEAQIRIQEAYYWAESHDLDEFGDKHWTNEEATFTIDISKLNGEQGFRLWQDPTSPNLKCAVGFRNVKLHN